MVDARNKFTWRLWLMGCGCIGLLLLLDRQLWRDAGLMRYVGRKEGMSAVVDEQFVVAFGASIKRRRLEERLRRGKRVEEVGKVATSLFKLLGAEGDRDGQRATMRTLIERFPRARVPAVISAYAYLADYYAGQRRRPELERTLRALLTLAEQEPADGKLISDVVARACRAGLSKFVGEAGGRALAIPSLPAGVRLDIAITLERFYREHGDLSQVRRMQVIQAKYRKAVNLARLVRSKAREINKLAKRKDWARARSRLLAVAEEYPAVRGELLAAAAGVCRHYAAAGEFEAVRKVWSAFKDMPSPGAGARLRRGAGELAASFVPALLSRSPALAETRDLLAWVRRVPGLDSELGYFLRGELWARAGAKGTPPKQLYLIRFMSEARVTLDGKPDDPVYREIEELPGPCWIYAGGETPLDKAPAYLRLKVKLFYTRKALVVYAFCPEPNMELLSGGPGPGAVRSPWDYDCVEFYLEFGRCLGDYQQWIVDANGGFAHLRIFNGYKWKLRRTGAAAKDKEPMQVAVSALDGGYGVEMSIPLSQLPLPLTKLRGSLMNANCRRLRVMRRGMKRPPAYRSGSIMTVSWAKLGFEHHTEKFDFVRFQ